MTAIDLLIIAVTTYGIWRCRLFIPGRRPSASRIGVWLVASGLLAICLFYAADLITMHALPAITSEQEAMALMDALHRQLGWLVVLLAVITISAGFVTLLSELQEREARARRLVDSNIIGVFIWGPDGRIIDANEALLRIVGYGRDDLVSSRLRWRELTPAEWGDADDRHAAELKAIGPAQPYEKEIFHKNGNRVPVLVGAANFEGKGDEGVAFVIDLTDRKRAVARRSLGRHHECTWPPDADRAVRHR
jgi:PAS domain S-box-containing protein